MHNTEFNQQATQFIQCLADNIEDQDIEGNVEVNLNADILTLETKDGIFVINKQSAKQEIWLSSPISGPAHFKYISDGWYCRQQHNLLTILSTELGLNVK